MAKSFTWGKATISANDDLTIADESRIASLANALPEEIEFIQRYRFAEFMVAAEVEGDDIDGLDLVTVHDEPEVIAASFSQWSKMKRRFGTLWAVALNEAESDSFSS